MEYVRFGNTGIVVPKICLECVTYTGASKPGHREDAVGSLSTTLLDDEIKQLKALYQPHPVLGFS